MSELLAPVLFACLVVALFAGFPVAFSLAAVAGSFGGVGIVTGDFNQHVCRFGLNLQPLKDAGCRSKRRADTATSRSGIAVAVSRKSSGLMPLRLADRPPCD